MIDPKCVPSEAEGPVDDTCGIFVSSSLGDDGNTGTTKDKPFKTIGAALMANKGKPIYVCAETDAYNESITVTTSPPTRGRPSSIFASRRLGLPISTPWLISTSSVTPYRARYAHSGPAADPVAGSSPPATNRVNIRARTLPRSCRQTT